MATVKKKQTSELVPYSGADQTVDLGSQNLTTSGTITAGSFVGPGSGSGAVDSVNGATGVVVLDTDDISEGATNKYFSTELAQDAVGAMVNATLVYTDGTPLLSRAAISGDITIATGSNTAAITAGVIVNADISGSAAIDASKIGGGTVSNAEFAHLDGVTSGIQAQFASRITYSETTTGSMSFVIDEDNMASNLATKVPTQQSVKAYADTKVSLTGNETIAGIKTFSSIPVGPASDPSTDNQLVRKAYVDAIAQSINPSLYKNACICATTANITLSGEQTIDGFATSATRVLVKDQTTTSQNGIYISDSGAWTRASDYNTAAEVIQGTSTFILDGSSNADKLFVMNAATVTTLGTDPITFTPIVSLTSYDAGTLIDITGSTISFTGTTDTLPAGSTNFFITDGDKGDITVSSSGTAWAIDNGAVTFAKMQDIAANKLIGRTGSTGSPTEITIGAGLTFLGSTLSANTVSSGDVGYIQFSNGIDGFDSDFRFWYDFVTQTLFLDGGVLTANQVNATGDINTTALFIDGVAPVLVGGNISDLTNDSGYSKTADIQVFTSSGTYTKPAGAKVVQVIAIAGGAGGGSGRKGAAGTVRTGGSGGGHGGMAQATFLASIVGATETISVGTGGNGGAAVSANNTNGNPGTTGTGTRFGSLLRAGGSNNGQGGSTAAVTGGTSGTSFPSQTQISGASSSGSGAAGGAVSAISAFAPNAGGAGGGITAGNVASIGGAGGTVGSSGAGTTSAYNTANTGGTGGATSTNGNPGTAALTNSGSGGGGGGGGGSSTTTNAGAGGAGGFPGGGGGGGGAAVNDVGNSGAGGAGGAGLCIVITNY